MYYLARSGVPVPAEAPIVATADEKHEWDYHQEKHQIALKNVKGLIDQKIPSCLSPRITRAHANTRRFCEDQRRAEIGRQNRILVDRLTSISKGCSFVDPRAPPQVSKESLGLGSAMSQSMDRYPVSSVMTSTTLGERIGSLNEPHRRKTKRSIEQDNVSLVRRILHVKSTFNPQGDIRDFKRHQRTVHLLQKLPDGSRRPPHPKSLPQLRPPRPLSNLDVANSGLEKLLLPWDLQRSMSEPNFESQRLPPLTDTQGAKADSYLTNTRGENVDSDARPKHTQNFSDLLNSEPAKESEQHNDRPPKLSSVQYRISPPQSNVEGLDEDSAWPDAETEKRRWLIEMQASQSETLPSQTGVGAVTPDASPKSDNPKRDSKMFTGMSGESDPEYDDEWDDYSMASEGSPKRSRSQTFRASADSAMSQMDATTSSTKWTNSGELQEAKASKSGSFRGNDSEILRPPNFGGKAKNRGFGL